MVTLFLGLFFVGQLQANIFLESPPLFSAHEMEKLTQNWCTSFNWQLTKAFDVSFVYEKSEAGFAVKLFKIPIYFHCYRLLPSSDWVKQFFSYHDYHFAELLHFQSACPQTLSFDQLCRYLNNKKFIFYTGAGISASAQVKAMTDLERSLSMDKGHVHFSKTAWYKPKELAAAFFNFCKLAICSPPTKAHRALKEIAEQQFVAIITENVDLLQQQAGINPLHTCSDQLHAVSKKIYVKLKLSVA